MEIWKPIENHEGFEVSNLGRIRSIDKLVRSRHGLRLSKSRIRRLYNNTKHGYPVIVLTYKGKTLYVHQLVAKAFIENTLSKKTVNHKNGIKTDNRVENLEWATHSENIKHAIISGLRSGNRIVKRGSRLDRIQVSVIKKCIRDGVSNCSLAKYFKVKNNLIANIKAGNIWKGVIV